MGVTTFDANHSSASLKQPQKAAVRGKSSEQARGRSISDFSVGRH